MSEHFQPARELEVVRETLQRAVDDMLYYSDEIEAGRLGEMNAATAVRVVAGFLSLTRALV